MAHDECLVRRMDGDFRRRSLRSSNLAGIHATKGEHVAQEGPIRVRVGAVEEKMCAVIMSGF